MAKASQTPARGGGIPGLLAVNAGKINWTDEEKESLIAGARPLFKQMVEEGHWQIDAPRLWTRHLLAATQDLVLDARRRRPVMNTTLEKLAWFSDRVAKDYRAVAAREGKKGKEVKPFKDRVTWTREERAVLIRTALEIRGERPKLRHMNLLRAAQERALAPERRRNLTGMGGRTFEWFIRGLMASPVPEEEVPVVAEEAPAPAPAVPPEPEPTREPRIVDAAPVPVDAFPTVAATFAPMIALNRAIVELMAGMRDDLRAIAEAMGGMAAQGRETRRMIAAATGPLDALAAQGRATNAVLDRVVKELDPKLAEPEPEPEPAPPAAEETPVALPPTILDEVPVHFRPKIAIVGAHATQVAHIREALESYADLRIFEQGREARNKRFSNAQYVITTQMVSHDVTRTAESIIGKDKVFFLNKSGQDAIIQMALRIVNDHVKAMEQKNGRVGAYS